MKIPFDWEPMDAQTLRSRVQGGWLVRYHSASGGVAMTMVPDPEHQWEVDVSQRALEAGRERLTRLEHQVQDPYVEQNIREELKEEVLNLKRFLEPY